MMILSIDETRVEEAAQYATDINQMKVDNCETVDTFYENIPAKNLYESFGFLKTDTSYTYSIESL